LPNGSTVTPDLVLGANDGDKHPQCIQHYQEDRSQQDKGDVKRDVKKARSCHRNGEAVGSATPKDPVGVALPC
jgi:hypothetical protein